MHSVDLVHKVALNLLSGVGNVVAKSLVAYCGGADKVFSCTKTQLEKIPGVGAYTASTIIASRLVLQRAEEELLFIEKNQITPLFFTDDDYPTRLKNCHDGPVMLYYQGNANLNHDKIVSVVGTRTPTPNGKILTEKLIADLSQSGCLVVSGLAYGIDITAHKAALDNGLKTIGVLAHGLDKIYPAEHKNYANKMIQQGGLLTEHISQTIPDKENFPKRNRIVAGMCDALVVVESKREGGSLITATIANSYNKDVFAFPGRPNETFSEGCNGLIKLNKATLIENAADLLFMMNWNKPTNSKPKAAQVTLPINLSEEENSIIKAFSQKNPMHIDEIASIVNQTVSKTSAQLLQLEFSNIIRSLPGKMYKLNH